MAVEHSVAKLEAQQQAMASDIHDMKSALSSIADSLRNLSGIEQRQVHLTDSIKRAHDRLDEVQAIIKDEIKGHEKRIQAIELKQAKDQWIERAAMAVMMGLIGLWIKGGL